MKNRITRIEVIDWKNNNGVVYHNWEKDNNITFDIQDQGRTLKVFIKRGEK